MAAIEPIVLRAGPFLLRPGGESDVDRALEMSQDPDIMQWYSTGVVDRAGAKRWLLRGNDWSDGSHATWVVADGADAFVGNFSMGSIDRLHQRSAQVSYRTAPWARNRGVARHALLAATRWAFDTLGLERLELPHAVANPASCRVGTKAGYRLEGVQRLGYRDDAGKRWDGHLHARLVDDPDPADPADPG
jgi:RimJ/RimL family protein N-acetyltransferase